MRLKGEYIFIGPREDVWELVRDPEVLATTLPGTQSLDQVSENEYEGKLNIHVGPITSTFLGRILVSDEVPPSTCTLVAEGEGKAGFVKGTGQVQLIDQGDGTTLMKYEGEVQIGGRLAGVGQRLLDTTSKSLIRQGLEALNKTLQVRVTAKSSGQEIEYKPPSETEFAATVAKDMAGEVLSTSRIIWLVILIIIIIFVVIAWINLGGGI